MYTLISMKPLPLQTKTDDSTLLRKMALHLAHKDSKTLLESFKRISGFDITTLIHQPVFKKGSILS